MPGVGEGRVIVDSPGWCRFEGVAEETLRSHLEYRDQRAAYEYRRFTQSSYNHARYSGAEYAARLQELKDAIKGSILTKGEDGVLRAPAGVAWDLARRLNLPLEDGVDRPAPRAMPWRIGATLKTLRPYQEEAVRLLLEKRHGAVELAPGTGKTLLALHLVKALGLSAVVCSPFSSIVQQTYREFVDALGARMVGQYGDGKKDLSKRVTIATMQSLRMATGEAAEFFKQKQVVIGDESHTAAADTLKDVCLGLLKDAPYRFWMSGTQLRTDGLQVLLQGIVGPVVLSMDSLEAQRQGYLTRTHVRTIRVAHGRPPKATDPGAATREVLYQSPRVNAVVAALINAMAEAGRPTFVLVDELDQFARLLPHLKHDARFAHACTDAKTLKKKVPQAYWKPDVLDLVDRFNAGEYPILVGTSVVGTGVDVRATGAGFYLAGGKSEISARQFAGRVQRLHPGKAEALLFDVDVIDGEVVHRHAQERLKIWTRVSEDVGVVDGLG